MVRISPGNLPDRSCFFILSDGLYLLSEEFNTFTFKVIIDGERLTVAILLIFSVL